MIPFNSDAPLYHRPWVTGGLILACLAVACLAWTTDGAWFRDWPLMYGVGLRPWQWVTRNFIHANPVHLLGNVIFLWAFGMIVEGKTGWWRMLGICAFLGVGQAALEQSCSFWFSSGSSLGISAIVSGLMAIALVWAPVNELQCTFTLGPLSGWRLIDPWEVPVWCLAGFYLGLDIAQAVWGGFRVSAPLLHSLGALFGLVIAFRLLKTGRVDCEGWDLLTLWRTRQSRAAASLNRAVGTSAVVAESPQAAVSPATLDRRLAEIEQLLLTQQTDSAWKLFQTARQVAGDWPLPESILLQLADALQRAGRHDEVQELLVEYLRRFEVHRETVCLQLARNQLEHQRRPRQALRTLALIADVPLANRAAETDRRELVRRARGMIADGVIEPADPSV